MYKNLNIMRSKLKQKGLSLKRVQTKTVLRLMQKTEKEPIYAYPWENLEKYLQAKKQTHISFIGYGSLVNPSSAAITLNNQSLQTYKPIIVFGVRRIFNYKMPENVSRYDPPIHSMARAALNVRVTGKIEDIVNGIVMKLSIDEIPAVRRREKEYDLMPVVCLDWVKFESTPFLAYILRCPDELPEHPCYSNNELMPHHHYYSICREGAAQFGEEFLEIWLKTTYLADGVTSVYKWEKKEFREGVKWKNQEDSG